MQTRREHDTLGVVEVAENRLWGAQTERARVHFCIGEERMPLAIVAALALIKQAAAEVHVARGLMPRDRGEAIARAAEEVARGLHADEFPLAVWQSGSGTMTNTNVNEVIAHRATELLGGTRDVLLVHPNDDVNRGQSTNDAFPTAIHVAAVTALRTQVLPEILALREALDEKARAFADVVKIGRTHLQDATPLTVGQEISGWVAQLDGCARTLAVATAGLFEVALGGTAVGTGINTLPGVPEAVVARIAELTSQPFVRAPNPFAAIAASDALTTAHGALRTLATVLHKIANDVRLLASGPRAGIGELRIPENEPGSSIMPGKVNPTQCEVLTMIAVQVIGNDAALGVANASGQLQLNAYRPLMAKLFLQSANILADGCRSFRVHCAAGIEPDRERTAEHVRQSLMLVTALAPHVGYDVAAKIARHAHLQHTSLRDAALALGVLAGEDFDRLVRPEEMVGPPPVAAR
jgi:fumarate hydratase class II